ncbi:MAG: hypothetical protein HFI56_13615 [Lachnospiraceae bacterium]|jgi:hypothetical protein|nr:hypothetical protein [Lachnospiraceae bacterium]MCI9398096.1 hypothetical protein [Lachnospiraceae bacterium]
MAKKFGKLLMVTAALGAVAGGVYYYLKGRDTLLDDDFDDDEDFDNFDDDLDESDADRNYVDLDLGKTEESSAPAELKEEFKEGIQAAKTEATDKVVGSVKKVEEFFDDDESDGSMDAM